MPALSLLFLVLTVVALVDIIVRDQSLVKHLPKMMWVVIVILLPVIGAALWFALGRVYPERTSPRVRRQRVRYEPRRPSPPPLSSDTRTTEQQIADLDREIEEWRLRDEIAKRRQEGDEG